MKNFKVYTFAILFICIIAIGTSIGFNGNLAVSNTTVSEAHEKLFNNDKQDLYKEDFKIMRKLVFGM